MANSLGQGVGMTSRRTRERLIQRLEEAGIRDQDVLDAIRSVPRHLFVDEALASTHYLLDAGLNPHAVAGKKHGTTTKQRVI